MSFEEQKRANSTKANGGIYCIPCGKVLSEKAFTRHFRDMHYSDAKYMCPKCQKIYKNRSSMASHIQANHQDLKGVNLDVFRV